MGPKSLAATAFVLCCSAVGESVVSGPPGDGWHLVFRDEFDGTEADLDATWQSQNGPSGHILCSRWRENATLEDGLLRLIARKEPRGGQDWTAASLWTRRTFRYGYFECRYRYAPTTGTNNSFWIMTRGKPQQRFEIDINEGHYPYEVNMNLHNWTGKHWAKGGRWYLHGKGPGSGQEDAGFSFVLADPIRTSKLRLVSDDPGLVRIMEFRAFQPSGEGYPSVFPNRIEAQPDATNVAAAAHAEASSVLESRYGPEKAIDGELTTASRWVSDHGEGTHALTLSFAKEESIGCLQFISGWQDGAEWKGIVNDFRIEYWDGTAWQPVPGASRRDLSATQTPEPQPENLGNTFHNYALLWDENKLVYYFDGKEIRRQEHDICRGQAHVWLSLAIMKWAGPVTDDIHGKSMDVDYVRIWQRRNSQNK